VCIAISKVEKNGLKLHGPECIAISKIKKMFETKWASVLCKFKKFKNG
jgi:hypothetical protein